MKRPKVTRREIDREAAEWVVRWDDGGRAHGSKEQARWFAWLRRSPRHVQAYFDIADLHERLGRMDPQARIDVDEWLAERRAPVVSLAVTDEFDEGDAEHEDGVGVASGVSGGGVGGIRTVPRRRAWRITAIAASIGVAIVFAGLSWLGVLPFDGHNYQTAIGEQTRLRLDDGSVMDLNTRSRARVAFTKEQRVIELTGEALFTVAHDAQRPFYVRTRGATVRAIGTKFNVYSDPGETRVVVVEGVVKVEANGRDATGAPRMPSGVRAGSRPSFVISGVSLSAGEAASVSQGKVAKMRSPSVKAAVAWQHQQLVFVDASLAEVAAQFNRYNKDQIVIDATVGGDKRLSGTFDALHPQSLLLYLRKDPAIAVEDSGSGVIVRGR